MIKAKVPPQNSGANLKNYHQTYETFSWDDIAPQFDWHETGQVNIVHEAVDRWAADPEHRDHTALIFEKDGHVVRYSFLELKQQSCRWANLFLELGLKPGDRVFIFLPRCPELYLAMLACARLGLVFSPLYSTLNYAELEVRVRNAEPRAILTHPDLAERIPREVLTEVEKLFICQGPALGLCSQEISLDSRISGMSENCEPVWLDPKAPLYLLYTSGSTGPPKGVVHTHRDMLGYLMTGRYVLDLRADDILWTDGDPAWVTGTAYAAFAPWLCGVTSVVLGDPFAASTSYRTLERHKVTVWYTTPRNINWMAAAGDDLPRRYDLASLRHITCVGESLAPELFYWVKKNLGLTPHENWWMTETGMICLANFPSLTVKPGSMGVPVPGVEAAVLDESGEPQPLLTLGQLALKIGWPAMMADIWRDEGRYQLYFRHEGWFLTGDMALTDEEGYFFHQGRNDDLIKVGDKLLGPFEVEHVLCRHPAVNEAAVISQTSSAAKPVVKAFVTLRDGVTPSARLNEEIKAFVKANLSEEIPLREVAFLDTLPKTLSGKVLRRVLRARELGLPGGDLSRLQD